MCARAPAVPPSSPHGNPVAPHASGGPQLATNENRTPSVSATCAFLFVARARFTRGFSNLWYDSQVTKQTAFKLSAIVQADHTVRLPDDVPIGPAELIVFVKDHESGALPALRAPSPIGLFEDDADVVDEAMGHISEMRASSRMRALP
jgi:hypothetical protein